MKSVRQSTPPIRKEQTLLDQPIRNAKRFNANEVGYVVSNQRKIVVQSRCRNE